MIKIIDFPKIESLFRRFLDKDNDYVVIPEINKDLERGLIGDENEVAATEKIHGT